VNLADAHIGRRVREIRNWRGMSQEVTADLAGISGPYLSLIERGLRPVTKRSTLEALSNALRVSPAELTGTPFTPVDSIDNEAHAGLAALEKALDAYDLGTDPEVVPRPWPQLVAAVRDLYEVKWVEADFAAQGRILPQLLAELHASYVRHPESRREILIELIYAYRAATGVCKFLGVRGLPLLAARLVQVCAEELGEPEWIGFASFVRGFAAVSPHQYALSVRAIDRLLRVDSKSSSALQVAGALHLNASLACVTQGDPQLAKDHLAEAVSLADRLPDDRANFGYLYIGPEHTGIWRVSLGTELGEGPKVAEYAREVSPDVFPGKARYAAFLADVGRSLASERSTRERGIQQLIRAEQLAPQLIRNNVFVRETVLNALYQARREAGGRELRYLAYRMGIAPNG
jgi:transcriptional regulator with XRE-family HTH domain